MKIDEKLSIVALKINSIIDNSNLPKHDEIEILVQLLIKRQLMSYRNDKEVFLGFVSETYDAIEEMANLLGLLPEEEH